MLTGDPEVVVRMLGFEVIQESNQTFSEHIVLIENCLTMGSMTKLRHQQSSLWHPGLTKDIEDLWEPWMRLVDRLLEDEQLLDTIYEAQGERYPQSRKRGREQTPAEVVLRLLLLKHIRNWSYDTLEREVRANLVYRAFTRIGDEKVPDAKTLARLGQVIARSDRGATRTIDGVGARARRGARTEDEGRYHGGGDEYPLSDRQQFIRRWNARAHANHEEGRESCGWTEEADS